MPQSGKIDGQFAPNISALAQPEEQFPGVSKHRICSKWPRSVDKMVNISNSSIKSYHSYKKCHNRNRQAVNLRQKSAP